MRSLSQKSPLKFRLNRCHKPQLRFHLTLLLPQSLIPARMRRRKGKAEARRGTSKRAKARHLSAPCTRSTPAGTRRLSAPPRIPAPPPTSASAFTVTASTSRACRSPCACEYAVRSPRRFNPLKRRQKEFKPPSIISVLRLTSNLFTPTLHSADV